MKKLLTLSLSLLLLLTATAQTTSREKKYFRILEKTFIEQKAYNTVWFVEQRWRLAGNSGFNESIYQVEKILQQAGYKKETNGEATGTLTYRIEKRPMKHATWEPVDASVYIVGDKEPLLQFKTNRNMIAMYSASTPAAGVTAELVYIGKGSSKELEGKDVKGKIVMAEGGIGSVYPNAVKNGAIGALAYSMPRYTQPTKYTNSIQFQGIGYTDSVNQKWGLVLSYAAKEKLKAALEKGPVLLKVMVNTKIYASEELTIVANVRGKTKPDERFVFSAHVQEPGANDNASGVGTLAEMARTTAVLVQQKKLTPQRTITFLWGDEIVGTRRYIQDDSIRAKGIKWGLSLDMIGEDIQKTGGTFLIEKMPDPSAVWTRGNEKHTEWGGSELKESELFPHYFNDLLLNRCLYEAAKTGWVVRTNPFEGGSDHTPFLNAKIPGLLMWHFTDVFYHTDADRLDMVSPIEMKHVGKSALATAFLLTTANDKTATALIKDITRNALQRLQIEFELSKKAVQGGNDKAKETHILEVWRDWYLKALTTTIDISTEEAGRSVQQAITTGQRLIKEQAGKYISQL
ncbi:peptidase M28 [Niastella yeongjuensis]|uniref:Peptidase M28 n=1 Tax=Niastella yeongjuensis TaxID=354355 RepID=A0A1V9EYA5_9BACT|nr:M28 family peptidase [Niastella yeongjuensis]OQP51036.1 peptidase M28 [Niastella yeongjuensis]SEN05620.1 Zn-dependent amino-or carboxypeptidase, M28 family [Niastella yeongjuensis]